MSVCLVEELEKFFNLTSEELFKSLYISAFALTVKC